MATAVCVLPLWGLMAAVAEAQSAPERVLRVGTKESPPFAYKDAAGDWVGISIELWQRVAEELELEYEFRETPLDRMIAGLETGELDAAVAAISVTAARQERVDFCHPHYTTGLGIAVRAGGRGDVWSLLRRVVSRRLMSVVGTMVAIIVVCGLLFWWLERDVNQGMFGGKKRQGIQMGVWWSTIILLGHKGIIPVSTAGRLLALSAMLASLLLLSVLTGVITSVLTVQQLDTGIQDPSDLRSTRVVTVAQSSAAEYLERRRIAHRNEPTPEAALQAVADGRADAVVYDKPLLRHLANDRFAATAHVLPVSFNTQEYAIALPAESDLRKPLNTALLHFRSSDLWDDLVYRYLGE